MEIGKKKEEKKIWKSHEDALFFQAAEGNAFFFSQW